jgi:hypothetical protein
MRLIGLGLSGLILTVFVASYVEIFAAIILLYKEIPKVYYEIGTSIILEKMIGNQVAKYGTRISNHFTS